MRRCVLTFRKTQDTILCKTCKTNTPLWTCGNCIQTDATATALFTITDNKAHACLLMTHDTIMSIAVGIGIK